MSNVADQARVMRMMIAERNLNARLQRATNTLNAISSIGAPTVPNMTSQESPPVSMEEVNRVISEQRKQLQNPCPTGYTRRSDGECVMLISSSAGLPLRTEDMGMKLAKDIPPLGFEQVYRGTTVIPGGSKSTELLSGLGFDLDDPCTLAEDACGAMRRVIPELQGVLAECALFEADAGKTLTASEVQALITDIQRACPAGYAPSQRSNGRDQFYGLGDMRREPTLPRRESCNYDVALVGTLPERYLDIKKRFNAMRAKYPGVGGSCVAPPEDLDTTGGDTVPEEAPVEEPKKEEKWWIRTPFLILGLTVGSLAVYRIATRKNRQ